MPILKSVPELTNQELLNELEKRVERGTIKIEFDSQVDGSTEPAPTTFGLSKHTLLIGMLAIGLLVFYSQSKSSTSVLTTVKINENK